MDTEEGDDQQPGAGKKPKLHPPSADGVENSSPEEISPTKKGLTSDSIMVGGHKTLA